MLGVVLPCLLLLSIHAPEFLSKKLRTRQLSESERVEVFREKHVWPPQWQEENEGYTELMRDREKELMQLPGSHERWENWMVCNSVSYSHITFPAHRPQISTIQHSYTPLRAAICVWTNGSKVHAQRV